MTPSAPTGRRPQRGEKILTAALSEEWSDNPALPFTHAHRTESGWELTGTKIVVDSAPIADLFLVPASTDDGVVVFLVQPGDVGVSVARQSIVDFGSAGQVDLDAVQLPADRVLGSVARGSEISEWIVERARLGSSAYQYGVLDQALKLTAEYARERVHPDARSAVSRPWLSDWPTDTSTSRECV